MILLVPIVPRADTGWWLVVPLMIAGSGLGLIPILAGLVGVAKSFRMLKLPDPKPSSAAEGMVLG